VRLGTDVDGRCRGRGSTRPHGRSPVRRPRRSPSGDRTRKERRWRGRRLRERGERWRGRRDRRRRADGRRRAHGRRRAGGRRRADGRLSDRLIALTAAVLAVAAVVTRRPVLAVAAVVTPTRRPVLAIPTSVAARIRRRGRRRAVPPGRVRHAGRHTGAQHDRDGDQGADREEPARPPIEAVSQQREHALPMIGPRARRASRPGGQRGAGPSI
jgi:hypothetical protein